MKDGAPAFLTVTSLELPDSPIPLIDSQAKARSGPRESGTSPEGKDDVMDELLGKVVTVRARKSKRNKAIGTSGASVAGSSKCERRDSSNLEEHTRRIIEGANFPKRRASSSRDEKSRERDCICSELSESSLRINIRKKSEVRRRSSSSQSPEVTHVIRIAMKYHGQDEDCKEEGIPEGESDAQATPRQDDGCCPGVSVALDFTLNCSSLHLTSRDVSARPNKARAALTHLDQRIEDGA